MGKQHEYHAKLEWTGNRGPGTTTYQSYERSHCLSMGDKPIIFGSSDPAFRGDPTKHNPEELLVGALAACHMLWYLHLCAQEGIVVIAYEDHASGIMQENEDGTGRFEEVALYPVVTVANEAMVSLAHTLHKRANDFCFIAKSVNFPVRHWPTIHVVEDEEKD